MELIDQRLLHLSDLNLVRPSFKNLNQIYIPTVCESAILSDPHRLWILPNWEVFAIWEEKSKI